MDIWQRAVSFAGEAAKKSQELTIEAAKRSQELTIGGSRFSDIVSETAKKSMEIAAEASKRADLIKVEALKQADKIKALGLVPSDSDQPDSDLLTFGVTDELREFVKEITIDTFKDFPLQLEGESEPSEIPTVSNVRQDLTQWQERHAKIVLSTVKEISKLRYELCPRVMKERKFWMIYFMIVGSHVAPYEKRYMEELEKKSSEQVKEDKIREDSTVVTPSKPESKQTNQQSKTSTSTEQDLDVFLLGDLGDSDGGPDDGDDGDDGFDDDFDKIADSSDDEKKK